MSPSFSSRFRHFSLPTLLFLIAPLPSLATRTFTVTNNCPSSIYVAVAGDGGSLTTTNGGSQDAGWAQKPGNYSFQVPDGWNNGRIWARTGCTLSDDTLTCIVGGCPSNAVACSGSEYGTAGATLAEFTIDSSDMDAYDISIVDGYNLGMTISSSDDSCSQASCGAETDILNACDPSLAYPAGSDKIYSCNSACGNSIQFQDGTSGDIVTADPTNSPVCCVQDGVAVDHTNCPNTYIPFYKIMKSMCNNAYVYSDDDMYDDAVYTCSSTNKPSYTVTFCPNGEGAALDPPSASDAVDQDTTAGDNSGNLQDGSATVSIWDGVTGTATSSGDTATSSAASTSAAASASSTSKTAKTTTSPTSEADGTTTFSIVSSSGTTMLSSATVSTSNLGTNSSHISSASQSSSSSAGGGWGNNGGGHDGGVAAVEISSAACSPTTDSAVRRDVGCLRGKRRIGGREVGC